MMRPISKGLPVGKNGYQARTPYTTDTILNELPELLVLEVGDSFLVEVADRPARAGVARAISVVLMSDAMVDVLPGRYKVMTRHDEGGVRIWRVF